MGSTQLRVVDKPASFYEYFCLLIAFVSQDGISKYIGRFWRIPIVLIGVCLSFDQILQQKLRIILVYYGDKIVGGFTLRKGVVESGTFPTDPTIRFEVLKMITRKSYEILRSEKLGKIRSVILYESMQRAFVRAGFVAIGKEWFIKTLPLGWFTLSWITLKKTQLSSGLVIVSGPLCLYEYND